MQSAQWKRKGKKLPGYIQLKYDRAYYQTFGEAY